MAVSRKEAVLRARADMAKRLGLADNEITEESVEDAQFPDTALGAPLDDEMSGQMITPGWRIRLSAGEKGALEYRASGNGALRLYNYKGSNYRI